MRTWSIKEVKKRGIKTFSRNVLFSIAVCLITEVLEGLGTGIHIHVSQEDLQNLQAFFRSMFTAAFLSKTLLIFSGNVVLRLLVGNVVAVGKNRFFLRASEQDGEGLENLLFGFKNGNYVPIVLAGLRRFVEVFLFTLLFIVPGIIKYLEHSMIPYIQAENPQMDVKEVFELSKEMTEGEKWNLFVFHLSFIGWVLLCGLLGRFEFLGEMLLNPYRAASEAEVYKILKEKVREGRE